MMYVGMAAFRRVPRVLSHLLVAWSALALAPRPRPPPPSRPTCRCYLEGRQVEVTGDGLRPRRDATRCCATASRSGPGTVRSDGTVGGTFAGGPLEDGVAERAFDLAVTDGRNQARDALPRQPLPRRVHPGARQPAAPARALLGLRLRRARGLPVYLHYLDPRRARGRARSASGPRAARAAGSRAPSGAGCSPSGRPPAAGGCSSTRAAASRRRPCRASCARSTFGVIAADSGHPEDMGAGRAVAIAAVLVLGVAAGLLIYDSAPLRPRRRGRARPRDRRRRADALRGAHGDRAGARPRGRARGRRRGPRAALRAARRWLRRTPRRGRHRRRGGRPLARGQPLRPRPARPDQRRGRRGDRAARDLLGGRGPRLRRERRRPRSTSRAATPTSTSSATGSARPARGPGARCARPSCATRSPSGCGPAARPVRARAPMKVTNRPDRTLTDLAKRYPRVITVSRDRKILRLYRGLKRAETYRVAIGQAGHDTPAGRYEIQTKETDPVWHAPDAEWAGELAGQTIPAGRPAQPARGALDGLPRRRRDPRHQERRLARQRRLARLHPDDASPTSSSSTGTSTSARRSSSPRSRSSARRPARRPW